jgi:hypothetical protein
MLIEKIDFINFFLQSRKFLVQLLFFDRSNVIILVKTLQFFNSI